MAADSNRTEPMDADTLEALRGSIAKWEGIVAGTVRDMGMSNCPLCQKFAYPRGNECRGCPVAERTGRSDCRGTPYYEHDEEKPETAQAELDFLKSLLPPDVVTDEDVTP